MDHAEDIALCNWRIRTHNEVRATQGVKVRGVISHIERAVEQLAQLFGGGRRIHVIDGIRGLGGSHMMCFRAHAADAVGEQRHFFYRSPKTEALEAAQLRDLEIGICDVAFLIEEDLDLAVALKAGNRINRNSLRHLRPSLSSRPASLRATASPPD